MEELLAHLTHIECFFDLVLIRNLGLQISGGDFN